MNRISRAFRATVVVSAFGYAAQALSLVAIPLFLSTIGRDGYGLYVTVMAFMGYLNFADVGLSWGSMILIAQAHGRGAKDEIASIVRHSAVLAAGSAILGGLIVGAIIAAAKSGWRLPMFSAHPEADRLIVIAGAQLVVTFMFGLFYNLFQGLQENYWTGTYQGLARLVGLTAGMFVAWRYRDVELVMLVQLGAYLIFGLAAALHVWRRYPWALKPGPWTEHAQYRAQLRIGAKNFLMQIGRTLVATAPTLAISSIAGPASAPLYTVPTTLLWLFFAPVNSWNTNMQSAYGEAWTSGARDWTCAAFRRTQEKSLLVGGLGIGVFLVLGDPFLRLWSHDRIWLGLAMAISVSTITGVNAAMSSAQYLVSGLNRHRRAAIAEIFNGVLALIFVSLAVHWFGIGAAGAGVLIAAAMTSAWVLRREVVTLLGAESFPPYHFGIRLAVAIGLSSGAAALVMHGGVPPSPGLALVKLTVAGIAAVLVFGGAAFGLKLLVLEEARGFGRKVRGCFFAPVI